MSLPARGLLVAVFFFAFTPLTQADEAPLERGRYLATIMDCAGCHTPMAPQGGPDFSKALQGAN